MKYSWKKCPNCRKLLDFKAEGGPGWVGSNIGPPQTNTCPYCGYRYSIGLKEWKDINPFVKAGIVVRVLWTILVFGGLIGFVLSGAIHKLIFKSFDSYIPFIALWVFFFSAAAYLWGRDLYLQIKESNERTKT